MIRKWMTRSVFLLAALLLSFLYMTDAQANHTTDPSEVRAINSIFEHWGIVAPANEWNLSGEPCNGFAITLGSINDAPKLKPYIKCDCTFNDSSTCHITDLRLYELNIVGVIPEQLWSLTFLNTLNLARNLLSGNIPPRIGTLVRLQYLWLNSNAFTGEVPEEIGNLTELIGLSFAENNFSGSLPLKLGNLSKLKKLYFSSSGVSGSIPSSYANLRSLSTLWAPDNNLTGFVPEFIGNWLDLTELRLQGNSFIGPIPPSFSKLTKMVNLIMCDISNGSSSIQFIRDMKELEYLVLRNNDICGHIPADLGDYKKLLHLDLSFNNLNGTIPVSLFSMISLSYLSLGNNKLTGGLSASETSILLHIDLSFNNLTGRFPSWAWENLTVNLIGNSFKDDSSSMLPSGAICLQQPFMCKKDSGRSDGFAVNCGGPQYKSPDGTLFESDDDNQIGPSSYYVSEVKRWAVSSVGFPDSRDRPSYQYTWSTPIPIRKASDPQLFQTAGQSASSLRYYGLGLRNGNYTVKLQFAEIVFLDDKTWQSHGRRVFDIYVQGILSLKDFDIRKESGGKSFQVVLKTFKAHVWQNYLEIHFFWSGKGTAGMLDTGTYGPLISAISVTADFRPSKKGDPLKAIIVPCVAVTCFLSILSVLYIMQMRKKKRSQLETAVMGIAAKPSTFSYYELWRATHGFSPSNKLGQGGFGIVYKGILDDGREVAVKQLSVASLHGQDQFVTEVTTISAVQHRNLVKLFGCCIHGDKHLLVYEYLVNKSLDHALFGRHLSLSWETRYNICLGVARGLAYLHEESRIKIVHRDVKASNILLDSCLIPKISDFGLARLYDDSKTHISTGIVGTIGYLAPEYALRGHLTEKADIFAFGIVVLEIVTGRANNAKRSEDETCLLEWVWQLYENYQEVDLVDPKLSQFNQNEVERLVRIGLLCTQMSPSRRPSMSRVVAMLLGDLDASIVPSKPAYLFDLTLDDESQPFAKASMISISSDGDPSTSSCGKQLTENASSFRSILHEDTNHPPGSQFADEQL